MHLHLLSVGSRKEQQSNSGELLLSVAQPLHKIA